jgi:hypothetical protein
MAIRFFFTKSDVVLIAYKASLPFEKKGEEKVKDIFICGRFI